jgi:hypothetical protein
VKTQRAQIAELEAQIKAQAEDAAVGTAIRAIQEDGMIQFRHINQTCWKMTIKGQDGFFSIFGEKTLAEAMTAAGLMKEVAPQ